MRALVPHLEHIYSHLKRLKQPIVHLLQDGLSRDVIERKLKTIPITLPDEVFELYSWRNGTRVTKGDVLNALHFFPGFYLLSLDDAISSYSAFKDDPRWSKYWFPIFANGGGDFYPIVGSEESSVSGEIVGFLLGLPKKELIIEFKSLEKMLQTISACYDEGIFYARSDGYLDVDDDRYLTLARKLNPHLESYDNL